MLPEIKRFQQWLRRKSPHASTHIHYTNDRKLFFAWIEKAPQEIPVHDVDAFIDHSQAIHQGGWSKPPRKISNA